MRILIVDDDQALGGLLMTHLRHLGHEMVRVCTTGAQACGAIQNEEFDCAFIDLILPDTDGLQLLAELKKRNPAVPVIMMSGYPTTEDTIEALRKGASDFLTKPFRLKDLSVVFERVARERKLLLENLSLQIEQQARKDVERLNQELQEKIREQTELFEISKEIDQIRSSGNLYEGIVSLVSKVTAAEKVGFFILSGDPNTLLLISDRGFRTNASHQDGVLAIQDGMIIGALRSQATHLEVKGQDLKSIPQLDMLLPDQSTLSCWPLRIREQLFGLLMTCHNDPASSFSESHVRLLDFLVKKAALAIENMALYESLVSNFYGILRSLVNAIEAKDLCTGKHSERVTGYAVAIARVVGCSPAQIESLQNIGYLHDIGKIGIADSILTKETKLTPEEYELIKRHPAIGESIVKELGLSSEERSIIRHHHESWNGKGFPDGLAHEEIPLVARVVTVADAFDAMTSNRPYRLALPRETALRELQVNAGRQFDPRVVEAFLDIKTEVICDSGLERVKGDRRESEGRASAPEGAELSETGFLT